MCWLIQFKEESTLDAVFTDLDLADDVALLGVSDSEVQANLHRSESLAEAVDLMINVRKTKNMGVKCEKPVEQVYPFLKRTLKLL